MQTSDRDAQIAQLEAELTEVRERERDLADFVENASLGLHWVGPDGRILWANQAELDLLGYARDEYVGHHLAEFHVDPPVIEDILRRLNRKETLHNYEARLRAKDGSIRFVQINSNVRWNGNQFLHTRCFSRDVTDRKRYEQRLLAQLGMGRILMSATSLEDAAPALLELICREFDWSAGLLWVYHDDSQDLRCAGCWEHGPDSDFARRCRKFTFAPGVGIPGRIWSSKASMWIADLQHDGNFPRLRLATEHGFRSAFGFPIMRGDRVICVMEFFTTEARAPDDELLRLTEPIGYQIGEFIERIDAQQRLAEREESYRVLAETASDGIITIDAASTILFANAAAARMFGYETDELRGSSLTVLMPEQVRPLHKAAIANYLGTGRRNVSWQAIAVTGQHRHGHEIPLEVSFGEYRQANKHIFVGVLREITERKRLEESVRQSAKLESLGVLAGGIAHDFNNLLTGILGNVSLAMEDVPEWNPATAKLQDVVEASERAAHLTKQLLAYAGKGRFVVEATDVSALVRQISALVRSSIPKHVVLRLDLQEPLPPVEADTAQLQQLVMNLVINGAEAVPEGRQGAVVVMTREQKVDAEYNAETLGNSAIAPGRYVMINVHDNGAGMDAATIEKIFDPFFTTKFTGRGLGLAAVQGIVRGHKGMLKVFSSPGEGTTFKVLLPVTTAAPRSAQPAVARPELTGQGTVLVVDDEPIVRKIATASLERYGYAVITAENGRIGVERFKELQPKLRLVILDMTMPVMSGEDALRHMRTINPDIPVVLSSGFNEAEAIRRFTGKGLAGFIQKPYTASALAEKVRAILQTVEGSASHT